MADKQKMKSDKKERDDLAKSKDVQFLIQVNRKAFHSGVVHEVHNARGGKKISVTYRMDRPIYCRSMTSFFHFRSKITRKQDEK